MSAILLQLHAAFIQVKTTQKIQNKNQLRPSHVETVTFYGQQCT